ncbi:MAG: AraC family transcriptional regulator [Ruminococcaceae bacterium]|nr:AraC family transcriptional regulator [Oscillospiraceae bacterium]
MAKKTAIDHLERQYMETGNYEFFHYCDIYRKPIEYHHHDFYELYYFIKGNVSYVIEERNYALKSGDILLIESSQLHRPFPENDAEYERMVIWIRPEFLQSISTTETDLASCFKAAFEKKINLIRPTGDFAATVSTIFSRIDQENAEKNYGSDILKTSYLQELLILITRHMNEQSAAKPTATSRLIERVNAYIEENIESQITLDMLASELFLSKCYMAREFKRISGCTLHRYIILKKLIYAKELIHNGETLATACYKSGFNEYSSFLRAFKREFGISPRQFN